MINHHMLLVLIQSPKMGSPTIHRQLRLSKHASPSRTGWEVILTPKTLSNHSFYNKIVSPTAGCAIIWLICKLSKSKCPPKLISLLLCYGTSQTIAGNPSIYMHTISHTQKIYTPVCMYMYMYMYMYHSCMIHAWMIHVHTDSSIQWFNSMIHESFM